VKITFMWKADDSNTGNCPALYEAPGGYVVQGKCLEVSARASLPRLADGQDAVWVPTDVLNKLIPDDSIPGLCEAVRVAPGGYLVIGTVVDAATRSQLRDLDTDEDAVFVAASVLDRLKG
jgi:hypothetical protein